MKSSMMHSTVRLAIAFFVVSAANESYGVPISVGTSAPNTNVLISQTITDGYVEQALLISPGNTNNTNRDLRQTFTAPADITLEKVSVLLSQYDDGGTNVNYPTAGLELWVDVFSATDVTTSFGTSLLSGGETGTIPAFNRSEQTWVTFDISDLSLTSGDAYGLRFFFNTPPAANKRLGDRGAGIGGILFADGSNPYTDGRAFRYLNGVQGTINGSGGTDMAFVLQGTGFTPPPPPPPPDDTAVITIDDTGAAPSTNIAIQQTVHQTNSSDARWVDNTFTNNHREFAQTFTVTSAFDLDAISLLVGQESPLPTDGQQFTIEVFSTDVDTPSGTSLFSQEQIATTPTYTAGEERWLRFDVEDIELPPGVYGFRIGFTEVKPTNFLGGDTFGGIYMSTLADEYAGGRAFRILIDPNTNDDLISAGYEARDLAFVLQSVQIPEPTTFAIAVIGLVGVVSNFRRIRKAR